VPIDIFEDVDTAAPYIALESVQKFKQGEISNNFNF
jgi:hypothetical protein